MHLKLSVTFDNSEIGSDVDYIEAELEEADLSRIAKLAQHVMDLSVLAVADLDWGWIARNCEGNLADDRLESVCINVSDDDVFWSGDLKHGANSGWETDSVLIEDLMKGEVEAAAK
jgi:hypothetical protein